MELDDVLAKLLNPAFPIAVTTTINSAEPLLTILGVLAYTKI